MFEHRYNNSDIIMHLLQLSMKLNPLICSSIRFLIPQFLVRTQCEGTKNNRRYFYVGISDQCLVLSNIANITVNMY